MSAKTAMTTSARPAASVAKPSLTRLNAAKLQRACACGSTSVGQGGQCSECGKAKSQSLQRTANSSTPSPSTTSETPEQKKKNEPILQRLAAGSTPAHHAAEPDDQKKDPLLQRKANSNSAPVSIPPSVSRTLDSPGTSLDSATRGHMEPLFGRDFSNVRVHNDSQAAASARDVDARAYTVGDHIAFAGGEYRPHTPEGQALLAHELAHTVQQSGLQRRSNDISIDTAVNSPLEREANTAARAVMRGESASVAVRPGMSTVLRKRCDHDSQKTPGCGVQNEERSHIISISESSRQDLLKEGVERSFKDGKVVTELYTYPNSRKGGNKSGFVDVAGVVVTKSNSVAPDVSKPTPEPAPARPVSPRTDMTQPAPRASKAKVTVYVGELKSGCTRAYGDEPRGGCELASEEAKAYVKDYNQNATEIMEASRGRGKSQAHTGLLNNIPELTEDGKPVEITELAADTLSVGGLINSTDLSYTVGDTVKRRRFVILGNGEGGFSYRCAELELGVPGAVAPDDGGAAQPADGLEDYVIDVGQNITFRVPKRAVGKRQTVTLDGPENVDAAGSVKGMTFTKLSRDRSRETIEAMVGPDVEKLPLKIPAEGKLLTFNVNRTTHKITIAHKRRAVELKLLSAGHITSLDVKEGVGLAGEAEVIPTNKLLGKLPLTLEFDAQHVALKAEIPKEKLNVPIPGFKITDAKVGFKLYPDYLPSGHIAFTIGPGGKNWVDGDLQIKAEGGAFIASANVTAHVPGMDETTGKFTYQYIPGTGGSWSGEVKLSSSKIPHLKRADAVMHLDDKGILLTGGLVVDLPGGQNELALTIDRGQDHAWILGGKARFRVPVHGVDDVNLTFSYDIANRRLKGEGSTGFEVKGLKGHITVHYDNGKIYGKGSLHVDKGRVSGELDPVEMDEHGKFSGKGSLQFKLSDDLVTTVTVEMTKEQEVFITGEIAFTKPILLFKRFGAAKTLFETDVHFPIPGLSIGIIGIEGDIGGSLQAGYYIGDAVIRNLKAFGTIRPLDENPEASIGLSGEFYVPAGGNLTGEIHAGVGVSIGIAGLDGRIGINASANLNAEVRAPFHATYADHKFSADLGFDAKIGLSLTLGLDASIVAYAGFSVFKVETEWKWPIASITYAPPGLQARVYLENPLHYDTESGLKIPSLSDFKWDKPKVDPHDVFNSILSSSTPSKSEKS